MISKKINKSKQVNQSVQELDLTNPNQQVFEFVKVCLLLFREHYKGEYVGEPNRNTKLERLLKFQKEQTKFPFMIQGSPVDGEESSKGKGREPDLAILDMETFDPDILPFYIIECKWLRTKRVSNGKEIKNHSSNQYVKGNTGGIERFKKGLYADWLTESLIIGYVLNEDMAYWHEKVNEWIKNEMDNNTDKGKIVWCDWDLLKEDVKEELNPSFISHHIRKSNEKNEWDIICLKHLWIKMD